MKKIGLVEQALDWAALKSAVLLKRKGAGKNLKGKPKGLAKLDDANHAGGKHALDCTLILTGKILSFLN